MFGSNIERTIDKILFIYSWPVKITHTHTHTQTHTHTHTHTHTQIPFIRNEANSSQNSSQH